MLLDDATFFVTLLWLYYRYRNADLENIQYHKLAVSCEYYDYCHFEHNFCEIVKFGTTKNSRDLRKSIIEEEETKKILVTWKKI